MYRRTMRGGGDRHTGVNERTYMEPLYGTVDIEYLMKKHGQMVAKNSLRSGRSGDEEE